MDTALGTDTLTGCALCCFFKDTPRDTGEGAMMTHANENKHTPTVPHQQYNPSGRPLQLILPPTHCMPCCCFCCCCSCCSGGRRLLLVSEAWRPAGLLGTRQCLGGPAILHDQVSSTSKVALSGETLSQRISGLSLPYNSRTAEQPGKLWKNKHPW